jgi:hypothetical protein
MSNQIEVKRINVQQEIQPVLRAQSFVESFAVETTDDAQALTVELSGFKTRRDAIELKRTRYVGPLNQVVKEINADFKPIVEGFDAAIAIGKRKLIAWNQEQQRIVEEAQRKAREEAARLAQAAAAVAAAAEAKAKAEEAKAEEANRSQAEIEGAQLAAAQHREVAAAAMTTAHMVAALPTIQGPKTKGVAANWDGEVYDFKAFVLHIANSPQIDQLLPLLMVDQIKLRAKAKLETESMNIAGARAVNKGTVRLSKAA